MADSLRMKISQIRKRNKDKHEGFYQRSYKNYITGKFSFYMCVRQELAEGQRNLIVTSLNIMKNIHVREPFTEM